MTRTSRRGPKWPVCVAAALALALWTSPALADDAARVAAIRERAILSGEVLRIARLAEACGRRDAGWAGRVRAMVIARQAEDAIRHADDVEGGAASVRWMMLGARLVADAAADAEHDRHGEAACRLLDASGEIAAVDRLLHDLAR